MISEHLGIPQLLEIKILTGQHFRLDAFLMLKSYSDVNTFNKKSDTIHVVLNRAEMVHHAAYSVVSFFDSNWPGFIFAASWFASW